MKRIRQFGETKLKRFPVGYGDGAERRRGNLHATGALPGVGAASLYPPRRGYNLTSRLQMLPIGDCSRCQFIQFNLSADLLDLCVLLFQASDETLHLLLEPRGRRLEVSAFLRNSGF